MLQFECAKWTFNGMTLARKFHLMKKNKQTCLSCRSSDIVWWEMVRVSHQTLIKRKFSFFFRDRQRHAHFSGSIAFWWKMISRQTLVNEISFYFSQEKVHSIERQANRDRLDDMSSSLFERRLRLQRVSIRGPRTTDDCTKAIYNWMRFCFLYSKNAKILFCWSEWVFQSSYRIETVFVVSR